MDFCLRISFILPITYCNCLFSSSIGNKITSMGVDQILYRVYIMLYRGIF
jgi:hypothetical protein